MSLLYEEFEQLTVAVLNKLGKAPTLGPLREEVADMLMDFADRIDVLAEYSMGRQDTPPNTDEDYNQW